MIICGLLLTPLFASLLLAFTGTRNYSGYINKFCSALTLGFALGLCIKINTTGPFVTANEWFYVDELSIFLVLLTALIGFSTAIFSIGYVANAEQRHKVAKTNLHFFYSMCQFFLCMMLLVITTNNLGILWVAMEGATLSTVFLVSLYRTPTGLEAAWKYLILSSMGLAQALLGTILIYFAAEKLLGADHALLWTHLYSISHQLSPHIMRVAFIFILVGYGTKAGLVPLHNWLPDAHGEGPAPVSALLSGLLLNVAIYAIMRIKVIVDGATTTLFTNHLLLGFGLLNLLVAAFFLLRQKEIKRLFAYSSIEHIGIITFAFGLGAPIAIFAALFHMALHSLCKTAAFFTSGLIIQSNNTSVISKIRGLILNQPLLGWGLLLSSLALMGLPPFGLFTSEFLIIIATCQQYPLLAPIFCVGLIIAFAAIFSKVQSMVFSKTNNENLTVLRVPFSNLAPVYLHLLLVIAASMVIPIYMSRWFTQIEWLLWR